MKEINEIVETLKNADNEGTESPYWLVIDPKMGGGNIKTRPDQIAFCIDGPFFSREDAENYLKSRRYAYSDKAIVWCHSGYWSKKYKDFYRALKK